MTQLQRTSTTSESLACSASTTSADVPQSLISAWMAPFVMNSRAEIERAILDYRRTGYGGWSRPVDDPVHPRDAGRFAKHADGRVEHPRT